MNGRMWSGWSRTKTRQRRKTSINTLLSCVHVWNCEWAHVKWLKLSKNKIKKKERRKHAAFVWCWWRFIWNITSFFAQRYHKARVKCACWRMTTLMGNTKSLFTTKALHSSRFGIFFLNYFDRDKNIKFYFEFFFSF